MLQAWTAELLLFFFFCCCRGGGGCRFCLQTLSSIPNAFTHFRNSLVPTDTHVLVIPALHIGLYMFLYWLIYIFFLYLMGATVNWVFQFLSVVPGLDYTFITELLSTFSNQTHNMLVRNLPYCEIMGKLIFAEALM